MKAKHCIFARWTVCLMVVLAYVAVPVAVWAQDPPPIEAPPGVEAPEAATPDAPPGPPEAEAAADDALVAVNLKNVDIENIVKFLSEITGKAVLKHKDVNVKISVYSSEKVTKERAFALVSDALMLESVALVEDRESVRVVPAAMVAEVAVELLPEDATTAMGGIIKSVITVEHSDVATIEALIKPLLSKTGSMVADPTSRKFIITDSARRVSAIREIVAEVDVLDTLKRKVHVFELRHATADELAPILKSVLSVMADKIGGGGGNGGGRGGQPQQPGQPPQPQQGQQPGGGGGGMLDVVAYKTANWVVVVAPEEIVEAAIGLVAELDRQKPQDLALKTLPVRFADPQEIAMNLSTVFQKQPGKRVQDTVEISADSRSSSLIVLSSEDNFEEIRKLVEELDTEESVQMTTKTYPLKYADAEDMAEQMNELYQGEQSSGRSPYYFFYGGSRRQEEKTRFVPERRANALIVIAKPAEIPRIEEMLVQLDTPIDEEQVTPRIFKLSFIDATEATDVLNEVFGSEDSSSSGGYYDYWYGGSQDEKSKVGRLYGKVNLATIASTNSIIMTTNNAENFRIVGDFIKELDQVSPDAANTIVVGLQNAQAAELADKLNALYAMEGARMAPQQGQGQQGEGQQQQQSSQQSYYSWLFGSPRDKEDKRTISNLIGQVRVVPDMRTNSLIITTAAQNFALLRELVEELDVESPKVLVKVRLIEVTTTKARRIGTRFGPDASVFETDDLDNGLRSNFGFTFADVYDNGRLRLDSGLDLNVLIQFIQRHADTRILSDTTISMNNNIPANVFVGTQIPFITNSQTTPEGALNQSFEYKDAGTTLKITPNINELDKVEMKIELEASQVRAGEVLFGGQLIDTRKFNTNIAVNSGDTIVIGGIMRESDAESARGIPILEKVPVLNLATRKKDKKRETTELIAFITPSVLRGQEETNAATEEAAVQLPNINAWRPLQQEPVAEEASAEEVTVEEADSESAEQTATETTRKRAPIGKRHGR